jgi:PAP2 superfamily
VSDLRRGPDRAAGSTARDDRAIGAAGAPRVAARLASLGAVSFGVVAIVYLLSAQTARGQRLENALFDARAEQLRGRDTAIEILATISVWSLVAAIAAVTAIALIRGRPRLALGAGAVIGVSILTTEVLKELVLPRPPLDPSAPPWHLDNVFPSGHTTIGMATAVAFVLVVPYRLRGPAAVAGAVYATAVAASTLDAAWHRTSDALGAIFLVGGVAASACAGLVAWRGMGPRRPRPPRVWAYAPLAVVAALGTMVVVVGSPRTVRAIDRGTLSGVGIREGFAVTVAMVAVAVTLVMVLLLAALRDVSLDAPD